MERIDSLIIDATVIAPSATARAALEVFLSEPDTDTIPVVFERSLLGVVERRSLMAMAIKMPQGALARLNVSKVMESPAAVFPIEATVGRAAHEMVKVSAPMDRGIIVLRKGAYAGLVPARAFIAAIARENSDRARHMQATRQRMFELRAAQKRQTEDHADMLARFAHEVRTPLMAMLGHAEQLSGSSVPDSVREPARIVAAATEDLAQLTARALKAGQIGADASPPTPVPFSLRKMLHRTVDLWRPKAAAKNLILSLDDDRSLPERYEGDEQGLQQILTNLVSNAVKYTDAGCVRIGVRGTLGHDAVRVNLSVTDTGIGIDPAESEALFKPFSRLSGTPANADDSSGLGLHIAQAQARRMGGDLTYAPSLEGGSVFTVSIPLRRGGPRVAISREGPVLPKRRAFQLGDILLVEDHAPSRALILQALLSAGWQVDAVATLAQARRRITHKRYQAILCDVHLKDGLGDELVADLRRQDSLNASTLCLAVTADASQSRRNHCRAVGFAGLIEKPIRAASLVTTLADYIASIDTSTEQPRLRARSA